MIKSKLIIPFLLLCILFTNQTVFAQGTFQQSQSSLPSMEAQTSELTLADIGFEEPIVLYGPYQEISATFTLPPDWNLTAPVKLELHIYSEFQSLLEAFASSEESAAIPGGVKGYLKIIVNGNVINETIVSENAETIIPIEIDPEFIHQDSGENEISISWDSEAACQYSVTSTLAIDPTSRIIFPYEYQPIQVELISFPKPFYSPSAISTYPIALVIPDEPDEDDLSALLSVSAGLGKQTNGALSYEIFSMDEINPTDFSDFHFIFIGKTDVLQTFFSDKMSGSDFNPILENSGGTNGILSMQVSPWNAGRALLLVSGKDGEALRKASAVIASNDFLPYTNGSTAIIQNISDPASQTQLQIDLELGELIQEEELMINSLGKTTITIPFDVSGDTEISPEAFIEIYFRHSQLINYLQSNLTVSVNGKMVGNIRFSDTSAQDGLARIIFPPNTIHPLKNTLEFTFNITSQDICADERNGNYWISIFKESYLHLPPTLEVAGGQVFYTLNDLPDVLLSDHSLSDLAFVANPTDLQSWKYAAQMAFHLGTFTKSTILQPSAFFTGSLKSESPYHTAIVIGGTNDIPFTSGINANLPLPLKENGFLENTPLDGIQFQMEEDQPFGILEIANLPDTNTLVFSILGSSEEGLAAAFQAAQNRLFVNDNSTANVEIIDGENNTHTFYIEPVITAVDGEQAQENWIQHFFNLKAEDTVVYLLIGAVLITVVFVIWIISDRTRAKKKSK